MLSLAPPLLEELNTEKRRSMWTGSWQEGLVRVKELKLGLVTYNLAKGWDIATIIDRCGKTGFEAERGGENFWKKPQKLSVS